MSLWHAFFSLDPVIRDSDLRKSVVISCSLVGMTAVRGLG